MVNYLFIVIIIFLPFQFALNIGDNFDLVTTRILIPALFLIWLIRGLARKKIWIPNRAGMWLAASFLVLSSLSLALGRDAGSGIRKLLYLFSVFPIFFVAADIFLEEKWRKKGLIAITISGTIAALLALVQFSLPYFLGIGKSVKIWENLAPFFLGKSFGELVAANSSWLVNIGGETRMRAFGFFPDPHNFAFFANLCLFTSAGLFFLKKDIYPKFSIGAGVVLMAVAIALSFSRGAYLSLLAGAIFFTVVYLKKTGVLGKAAAAAGIILILIFILKSSVILQRLTSSFDLREGSNAERYKNWVEAAGIIRDYPLGGVGLGDYARAVDPTAGDRSPIYAHNLFLDVAAETGILNAVIFLALVAVSIWRNIRNGSVLNLGIAAGLVGFLVHSVFDTALWSPQVLTILLVIIAMELQLANLKTKRENGKTTTKN